MYHKKEGYKICEKRTNTFLRQTTKARDLRVGGRAGASGKARRDRELDKIFIQVNTCLSWPGVWGEAAAAETRAARSSTLSPDKVPGTAKIHGLVKKKLIWYGLFPRHIRWDRRNVFKMASALGYTASKWFRRRSRSWGKKRSDLSGQRRVTITNKTWRNDKNSWNNKRDLVTTTRAQRPTSGNKDLSSASRGARRTLNHEYWKSLFR